MAAAGPIAFVGLTVPHVARALVGPDYRWIVPYSIVLGAILLLAGDVSAASSRRRASSRWASSPPSLGAPFFIWLVRRRRLAEL